MLEDLSGPTESEFLSDILSAFGKRRKALRHKLRAIRIDKIVERSEEGDVERLDVLADVRPNVRIILSLWSSRRVRVWTGEMVRNKGWAWQYDLTGRLVGAADDRTLVEAFEQTRSAIFQMTAEQVDRLAVIWVPLLARGPQAIR